MKNQFLIKNSHIKCNLFNAYTKNHNLKRITQLQKDIIEKSNKACNLCGKSNMNKCLDYTNSLIMDIIFKEK